MLMLRLSLVVATQASERILIVIRIVSLALSGRNSFLTLRVRIVDRLLERLTSFLDRAPFLVLLGAQVRVQLIQQS